jgi:hypothetical protein
MVKKIIVHLSLRLKRIERVNDPSAGSPTETLLRLLLPLDDQICLISSMHKEDCSTKCNSP